MKFSFTAVQQAAKALLAGSATHILLRGGSRSGKTFVIVFAIIVRALCAPNSRHAILGFRFNRVRTTIGLDTFPKVMRLCFPNVPFTLDKKDWYWRFENGSEIWLGGLDDKERTEKILGYEFCTIFLNEISQLSNDSRELAMTRLAQKAMVKIDGEPERELRLKVFYDANPPKKSHWSYKLFVRKINPEDNKPLPDPENYAEMQMNPDDNAENIGSEYLKLLHGLSASKRRRFLMGEWGEANPNQLFDEDNFERYRVLDQDELPDMVRIVVMLDPSGADDADNEDNDAIGIVVAGLGTNGIAYVLEDRTVKAGPATWGKVAVDAYNYHDADVIGAEVNFGGAMVKRVIRTTPGGERVPFKPVRAARGKHVRADPVSALYEQGKVRHCGYLRELEDELVGLTTHGYEGPKSPNRADALVWAIYALFPHLTKPQDDKSQPYEPWEPLDSSVGY